MDIAIVDDEKVIREQIKELILTYTPNCNLETFASGEDLLAADKTYHMVFLDIQMEGMNGIDVARAIREKQIDSIIIFITAIKEYVFDAFDVLAFHYLLKPIGEKKFSEVFTRATKEAEHIYKQGQDTIFISARNRNFTFNLDDIVYIESRRKKVEIHTTNEIIEAYATMIELEKELGGKFYRCHRGYLVNMAHIVEYESDSITLTNRQKILMSKERYKEFVKEYMRYLRSGGTVFV